MSVSVVDTGEKAITADPHYEERCNLAAAFRMTARLGMDEAVGNHFSYAISDDGSRFLVNPFGRHFANLRASDLLCTARGLSRRADGIDVALSRSVEGVRGTEVDHMNLDSNILMSLCADSRRADSGEMDPEQLRDTIGPNR